MSQGTAPAPFLPDIRRANCAVNEAELAQLLNDDAADEAGNAAPPIAASEQAKFVGYDYRTRVNDGISGRTERVPSKSHMWLATSLQSTGSLGPESTRNATVTGFSPSDAVSVGSGSTMNYASLRYGKGGSDGGSSPALSSAHLRGVLAAPEPAPASPVPGKVSGSNGSGGFLASTDVGSSSANYSTRRPQGGAASALRSGPPVMPSDFPPGGVLNNGSSLRSDESPAVWSPGGGGAGVASPISLGLQEFPALRNSRSSSQHVEPMSGHPRVAVASDAKHASSQRSPIQRSSDSESETSLRVPGDDANSALRVLSAHLA